MAGKMSDFQESFEKILVKNCPELKENYKVTYKNCFGAMASYADDNIFGSFGKFGLALKLPEKELIKLKKEGCKELKYFPKGHIKKDYAIISKAILENKAKIGILIQKSVKFVTE
jgi:TfoX/Sxy family transcriptional regulator of competence genes